MSKRSNQDEAEAWALLRQLVELNPGLANSAFEEVLAVLEAYREDLVNGRNPEPPYLGLLPKDRELERELREVNAEIRRRESALRRRKKKA